MSEAHSRRVRGLSPRIETPHPPSLREGTFSHKGRRRKGSVTFPGSIRRQRNLIVDQGIERRLDVDLGVDDAGLLQGDAGREDGLALRRADAAVGQLGTFLELL